MSIELHCPQCGKLIRAPQDAAGRQGKCPYCKRSVYIPLPEDQLDTIPIAPIDAAEAEREAQLRRESTEYAAAITKAQESDAKTDAAPRSAREACPSEVVDFGAEVTAFVVAMRDSKLDEAEQIVAKLRRSGSRARDYAQGLIVDQMPFAVDGVPPPLTRGFLQTLLDRLG